MKEYIYDETGLVEVKEIYRGLSQEARFRREKPPPIEVENRLATPLETEALVAEERMLKQAEAKKAFVALAIANQNTAPWGKALYALGVTLGMIE